MIKEILHCQVWTNKSFPSCVCLSVVGLFHALQKDQLDVEKVFFIAISLISKHAVGNCLSMWDYEWAQMLFWMLPTGDPLDPNQIFWLWLSNEKFKLVGLNRMTQKAQNNIFWMVLFQGIVVNFSCWNWVSLNCKFPL